MPDTNGQVLTDAVARGCAAILSLPSAGMLRHQKSRFLSETESGLWIETGTADFPLIEELIVTRVPAGVSFKSGQTKIVFASPILQLDREHRINSDTVVAAVLIAIPEQVKAIQRRNNYRIRIFDGCGLSARVWRIAPRVYIGDRPMSTAELSIVFRDLSIGGMGVAFMGKDGEPPKVGMEDRLRVEIRLGENALLIEGRMRQPVGSPQAGAIFTGIQFKDMGSDIEGRQKLTQLTRIIGEMQREEVRRARLGIA